MSWVLKLMIIWYTSKYFLSNAHVTVEGFREDFSALFTHSRHVRSQLPDAIRHIFIHLNHLHLFSELTKTSSSFFNGWSSIFLLSGRVTSHLTSVRLIRNRRVIWHYLHSSWQQKNGALFNVLNLCNIFCFRRLNSSYCCRFSTLAGGTWRPGEASLTPSLPQPWKTRSLGSACSQISWKHCQRQVGKMTIMYCMFVSCFRFSLASVFLREQLWWPIFKLLNHAFSKALFSSYNSQFCPCQQ